jgi:DegV family protein with EDD domain
MTIRVVTDSTCDLPPAIIAEHHITVVPLYVNFGDESYRDGVDLTREEFYRRLPEAKQIPTTAAPGPEIFREAYDRLADEGATEVISIHISISLSGTLNPARLGARDAKIPVTVFDSRQLSMGTGFLVLAAAEAAAEGKSMREIIDLLEDQTKRTHVFAALDTLEFLRRSGRMSWAVAGLGNLLQIKPLLRMYDGEPSSEKVRTRRRALERVIELLRERLPLEKVALLHTYAHERAGELRRRTAELLADLEVPHLEINPVIGAHIGPGAVGFVCVTARED